MKSEDIITLRTSQIGIFLDLKMCDEKLLAYATKHNLKKSFRYIITEDKEGNLFNMGKWIANSYMPDNRLYSKLKCVPVELKTSDKKKSYKKK
tara:strand:+ start:78 stop:356 length:279 start_codon:yes stop_codon:yes gene_type:complete